MFRRCCCLVLLLTSRLDLAAGEEFGPYAEPDFPFLTSSVDLRDWEKLGYPKENLVPRGVIVKLGHQIYACFDTDLLRWAAVWKGKDNGDFLTWTGIAPISYHTFNKKADGGQSDLPKPVGTPLFACGRHPGFVLKRVDAVSAEDFSDPRPVPQDAKELGRGPVPSTMGRWLGIRLSPAGRPVLEYRIGTATIREELDAGTVRDAAGKPAGLAVRRRIACDGRTAATLELATFSGPDAASAPRGTAGAFFAGSTAGRFHADSPAVTPHLCCGRWLASIAPSEKPVTFSTEWLVALPSTEESSIRQCRVEYTAEESAAAGKVFGRVEPRAGKTGGASGAFAVDAVPLPLPNPWRRNVRLSGLDFFPDGRALLCTIDGDVWMAEGLDASLSAVVWTRCASGLHEPQSIKIRDGVPFAFTRDGIVRLHLDPVTMRCTFYENFCNLVPQTAETREFPQDMVLKPGGGFYIAKGGQQLSNHGPAAGRIFEIAADGGTATEICSGLRMPYLGIHPRTGVLTASDQQGHHIPTTPLHFIKPGAYYGFPEAAAIPPPETIEPPAVWIPHAVNQSAAGQVWCVDSKMGPLDGSLLHLAYFRPAVFKVYADARGEQGAVVPLGLKFDFPLLKDAVNPKDGLLYVCGFQIWGTEAKEISGLARLRPTGKPSTLPAAVRATRDGIFLKFHAPLHPDTPKVPQNFTVQRWNYRRTKNYGSPHYRLDGSLGQELLQVAAAALTPDGTGLFLRIVDMKPAMQLQVDWRLQLADGGVFANLACLTVRELPAFDFAAEQIDKAILQAKPPEPVAMAAAATPTAELGKSLATQLGCLACHSTDGKMEGMKGPTWLGLFGSEEELVSGKRIRVDRAHLRESILNPPAKVRKGFDNPDVGMPPYAGILSDPQIEAIILFVQSLATP